MFAALTKNIFMLSRIAISILTICLSFVAFAQKEPPKAKVIDPANMDPTTRPGDDFMTYAGGHWIKNNPVPPKETRKATNQKKALKRSWPQARY